VGRPKPIDELPKLLVLGRALPKPKPKDVVGELVADGDPKGVEVLEYG
jgi:hypothetical protein